MCDLEVPNIPKAKGRSVSICDERQIQVPEEYRGDVERKTSSSSFLLPAVNLARRLSMKITGHRDGTQTRRRKRRSTRPDPKGGGLGRRKSVFDGRSSIAQLSLDMERGIIIIKEEDPHPIVNFFQSGVQRIRTMFGLPYSGVPSIQLPEVETISLQQIEAPNRYRPVSLRNLANATGFTETELKKLYRGFKTECPTGVVDEEGFHNIYTSMFPWGEEAYHPHICSYSHYIFSLLDETGKGVITFEDFVLALSLLYHGSEEERIKWTFRLYDLNGDGYIQKDEMFDVSLAIFDLMGKKDSENTVYTDEICEKINNVFEIMDTNEDGVISLDEFISYNRGEMFEQNANNILGQVQTSFTRPAIF